MRSLFSKDPAYKPYMYEGLKGRYAHWPAFSESAKRTFVVVYGQHATLERIRPIAEALRHYGDVYIVDTPGFGGMDSPYKIKKAPDLDFFAGHLNYFIKNNIPTDRKITLLGISYGFQIITTALARHKVLQDRVEQVISFVGFVHYKDFSMPLSYHVFLRYFLANTMRTSIGARLFDIVAQPPVFRLAYFLSKPFNVQYRSLNRSEVKNYVNQQAWLWIINDTRTHAATAWDFWEKNDLTVYKIKNRMVHVGVPRDHLLNNSRVSEELKNIYEDAMILDLNLESHAPLEVDNPDKVSELLPDKLKAELMTSRNQKAVL